MTYSRPNPIPALFMALLVVAAFVLLASAPAIPALRANAHSFNHEEAEYIHRCNNILSIWINKSCERLNILKQLDDGRVVDEVIQPCKASTAILVTAYVIGGGDLKTAEMILRAKGCSKVWP